MRAWSAPGLRLAYGREAVAAAGRAQAAVGARPVMLVRRPGVTLAAPLSWRVEPADTVIPVRYSSRRLAPIANRIALVLAIGAVGGLLLLLVARRRPFAGTRPFRMIGKDAI